MLFVPFPFLTSTLLALLFLYLLRNGGTFSSRSFLALIGLCAIQSTLVGLRWGYGLSDLRYVVAILAACLPPLTFASFVALKTGPRLPIAARLGILGAPAIVALLFLTFPQLVDLALFSVFVGYALALLIVARSGPDELREAQLEFAPLVHRLMIFVAVCLIVSAVFDLMILLDVAWAQGENVALIAATANLAGLACIGCAAAFAGRWGPTVDTQTEPEDLQPSTGQDAEVLARLSQMMSANHLYRDEDLNLGRLARRLGLPSRQVSGAINRVTGKNVSQYVNDFRIDEACRLIQEDGASITRAMLESGFQTKSNFNREFRRIKGKSPVAWRRETALNVN